MCHCWNELQCTAVTRQSSITGVGPTVPQTKQLGIDNNFNSGADLHDWLVSKYQHFYYKVQNVPGFCLNN